MGKIIGVAIVLAIVAFALGRLRDGNMANRIGREVATRLPAAPDPAEDPVVLLEKLDQLYRAGVLTEAEFRAQKARILGP